MASLPLAAVAGPREDGIALLRKQAKETKSTKYKTVTGSPFKSAAKCSVDKPCAGGPGFKWDAEALGVGAAEKRTFIKK